MAARAALLVQDLTKQAARQRHVALSRQWTVVSLGLALAVSFVSVGMIVKAFFWGLVISCGAYYAYLEYTPFDSNASLKAQVPLAPMPIPASTEPMRIPEPPKVVPIANPGPRTPLTTGKPSFGNSPQRLSVSSPEPRALVSYNPQEVAKLADSMMKARKPNETDSAVRPGAVTSTFSPFTSPAPSTTRVDQTYHLSPLKELQTPTVAPDTLGSASFGGSTLRVRDATKALRLAQIRDEWIEQLRRLLAKHLMSIMEMYQESVRHLSAFLTQAAAQALNAEDIKLVISLLDFTIDQRQVELSTKQSVTLDDCLGFCQRLGASADLLRHYNDAISFFKICQTMADAKNPSSEAESSPHVGNMAGSMDWWPLAGRSQSKSFVARLKDMVFQSLDGPLRVQWPGAPPSNAKGMNALSDQEIAVAIFLHKCESLAKWKPAFTHHSCKFSQAHYATSHKDIQRISSTLSSAGQHTEKSLSRLRSQEMAHESETWCIALLLNPPVPGPGAGLMSSSAAYSSTSSAFFGVYRAASQEGKDLLAVDRGRNDCFEAIIVFLLVLYLTYQHTDDESSRPQHHGTSSAAPSIDFILAKDLLRDVMGWEELRRLATPSGKSKEVEELAHHHHYLPSSRHGSEAVGAGSMPMPRNAYYSYGAAGQQAVGRALFADTSAVR